MLATPDGDVPCGYLPRYLDSELEELLSELPALAIDGAKGVGKTETASRHVDVVLELDSPEVRQLSSWT